MEITLFYIPTGSASDALAMGNLAIEEHLAGCANVFPIQSVFPWNGSIQNEHEFVLVLKTMPYMKTPLRSFLESRHSYETPCIISWDAEVNERYGLWIKEQLKADLSE